MGGPLVYASGTVKLFLGVYRKQMGQEGNLMDKLKKKKSLSEIKTSYFALFGAAIGAVIGLVAYVNNWLG